MALTKVTGQVIKNTTDVTVGVLTVTNTLAVGGTVSIGGTLTYEDVTNVDAVGLITARNGIVVGSGITLSKDGDIFFEPPFPQMKQSKVFYQHSASWDHIPDPGKLILFPGWLPHGVKTNTTDTDRISLSFNTFVNDSLGDPRSLTHVTT